MYETHLSIPGIPYLFLSLDLIYKAQVITAKRPIGIGPVGEPMPIGRSDHFTGALLITASSFFNSIWSLIGLVSPDLERLPREYISNNATSASMCRWQVEYTNPLCCIAAIPERTPGRRGLSERGQLSAPWQLLHTALSVLC